MWKKPLRKFTYLDWLKFVKYDPEARKIQREYKKKLAKLKGVDFMTCQGEMFRELGKSYRELRDQRDKSRRESHSTKLKAIAQKQATRAKAGRRIRSPVKAAIDEEGKMKSNPKKPQSERQQRNSRLWLDKTKESGKKRF